MQSIWGIQTCLLGSPAPLGWRCSPAWGSAYISKLSCSTSKSLVLPNQGNQNTMKHVNALFSVWKGLEDDLLRRGCGAGHKMVCPGHRKNKTSLRLYHHMRQGFPKAWESRSAVRGALQKTLMMQSHFRNGRFIFVSYRINLRYPSLTLSRGPTSSLHNSPCFSVII